MKTYIELSECLLFDLKEFNKEMNSEIDIYNERLYSIDQQIRSIQRMEIPEYVETIKKHHNIEGYELPLAFCYKNDSSKIKQCFHCKQPIEIIDTSSGSMYICRPCKRYSCTYWKIIAGKNI